MREPGTEQVMEIVSEAMNDLGDLFALKDKARAWTDGARRLFLKAFAHVPVEFIPAIVDELINNPPCDRTGFSNYTPTPADVVTIARRMTQESDGDTVAKAVAEIWAQIGAVGYIGSPKLSRLALAIVQSMGGWYKVCTEETPHGVLQGQMLKIGAELVLQQQNRPIFAGESRPALPQTMGRPRIADREQTERGEGGLTRVEVA